MKPRTPSPEFAEGWNACLGQLADDILKALKFYRANDPHADAMRWLLTALRTYRRKAATA